MQPCIPCLPTSQCAARSAGAAGQGRRWQKKQESPEEQLWALLVCGALEWARTEEHGSWAFKGSHEPQLRIVGLVSKNSAAFLFFFWPEVGKISSDLIPNSGGLLQ